MLIGSIANSFLADSSKKQMSDTCQVEMIYNPVHNVQCVHKYHWPKPFIKCPCEQANESELEDKYTHTYNNR